MFSMLLFFEDKLTYSDARNRSLWSLDHCAMLSPPSLQRTVTEAETDNRPKEWRGVENQTDLNREKLWVDVNKKKQRASENEWMRLNYIWPLSDTTTRCSTAKKNVPTVFPDKWNKSRAHKYTSGIDFQNKTWFILHFIN